MRSPASSLCSCRPQAAWPMLGSVLGSNHVREGDSDVDAEVSRHNRPGDLGAILPADLLRHALSLDHVPCMRRPRRARATCRRSWRT